MSNTPFCNNNKSFSDKAHLAAARILYPKIFDGNEITINDCTQSDDDIDIILDRAMGIDKTIRVNVGGLNGALSFTFQERFRRPDAADWRDITITEWNRASELPSELYKINAGIFLYAYYDPELDDFIEAVAFDTTAVLYAIAQNNLKYDWGENPRSNQTFITILFDELERCGFVLFHYRPEPQKLPSLFDLIGIS